LLVKSKKRRKEIIDYGERKSRGFLRRVKEEEIR